MVEVLSESTAFSSRDGEKISANVLLVNFRRLKGHNDEEIREKREGSIGPPSTHVINLSLYGSSLFSCFTRHGTRGNLWEFNKTLTYDICSSY